MKDYCVVKTTVLKVSAENEKQARALAKLVDEKGNVIIPGTSVKTVNYEVMKPLVHSEKNNF